MDICANAVLAAACLATQPLADVRLPTGEAKPLSLYFVTVAKSGERKTSVDNLALAAIKGREEELRREYGAEHASFENSTAAWEQERAKIKADRKLDYAARKAAIEKLGAEPIGPILPVLLCPEPTFEGLIRLLAHGQPSVGVFTSEGGIFVGGHGFTDEPAAHKLRSIPRMGRRLNDACSCWRWRNRSRRQARGDAPAGPTWRRGTPAGRPRAAGSGAAVARAD